MRSTTIIAGSTVAALATAGILAVSGSAEAPTGQTIQLVEKSGIEKFVDTPPKAKRGFAPSVGDQFLFSYPLVDSANKRVGTLDARCGFTKGASKPRGVCDGVFALPGGDLLFSTRLDPTGNVKGAIVGGTAAYAGARGTFISVDTKGGDHDTITLLP